MTPPREPKSPYIALIPTPDVSERVVQLFVPQKFFSASTVITSGMTLTAFLAALTPTDVTCAIEHGYDSYTLTQPVLNDTAGSDGTLSFYFAKPKTSSSILELTPFKEETKWQDYPWPAVILTLYGVAGSINFEKDNYDYVLSESSVYNFDLTRSREVAEDRLAYVPAQRINTEVIIRHYLSNTPFTDGRVETPVTDTVQYHHRGMQRSIECIHPLIRVPELLKNGKLIPDFGTPNALEVSRGAGQVFPATLPMSEWQDHIFDAKYSEEDGIYSLITFEAIAPALPDPILL